jgi:small-conductance mechanosensitive channel
VTGVVKNLVRNDRTGGLVIPLTVTGSAYPEKVREVLKAHELVLNIPSPQVLFAGMSASVLNFELNAFISDVETMFRVRSGLHFAIFKRFKEEKFFDTPGPEATMATTERTLTKGIEIIWLPFVGFLSVHAGGQARSVCRNGAVRYCII